MVHIFRKLFYIKIWARYIRPSFRSLFRYFCGYIISKFNIFNITNMIWAYSFCSLFGYLSQFFIQMFICFLRQELLIPCLVVWFSFPDLATAVLQTFITGGREAFTYLATAFCQTLTRKTVTIHPNVGGWYQPSKKANSYAGVTEKLQKMFNVYLVVLNHNYA